jgi:hypothetical protein
VSALAWWLIPLVATVLAVLFVMLRSRPAKPTTAEDSMQRLRRMQEAMERPMPSSGNVRISDPAGTPDAAPDASPGGPADPTPQA